MKVKINQIAIPDSLRTIQDATRFNISGDIIFKLNYLDVQILIFNFLIEKVNKLLWELRQERLRKKGIANIEQASEEDFNRL